MSVAGAFGAQLCSRAWRYPPRGFAPANILLGRDGTVKLPGFGLAKSARSD